MIEAAANAERFLRAQARARPGGVVRLITGRGRAAAVRRSGPGCATLLRALRDDGSRWSEIIVLEDSEGSFLVRLAE